MKAKEIRKGTVIIYKDAPHSVMDFQHRTPGNLRAFVQAKLRNLINGSQTETRFSSTEDLPEADVFSYNATYLYGDDSGYHFMNSETYDQISLQPEMIGDNKFYLMENMTVQINTFNSEPISIELPKTVILTVEDTEPELRGATASNSPKPARMNTGVSINVPAFIKIGERVLVDTVEGIYLNRADDSKKVAACCS